MEYTIEQFENDFENASFNKKKELLDHAMETFDMLDPGIKQILLEKSDEINDLRADMALEDNDRCVRDIESGSLDLFKCLENYDEYVKDQAYYAKFDDVKSDLMNKFSDLEPSESLNTILLKIKEMNPIIYIYSDDGLGSLKKRKVFAGKTFSRYFEKI